MQVENLHISLYSFYRINIDTIKVAINPAITGIIFFRARSNGLTLQMAATGMMPQGMMVPPPNQIAEICPSTARDSLLIEIADGKVCARELTKGRPDKPGFYEQILYNGLSVAYQQSCFLTCAEEILHALYFKIIISGSHAEVTHGISFASGIGIFISGLFKAGNFSQSL